MIERKEIIYGYSGFKNLCYNCDRQEIQIRGEGFHGQLPEGSKHVFLTIIKTGYDNEGKEVIKGEFYCQTCGATKLREMGDLIGVATPPEANLTKSVSSQSGPAFDEWKRLWWESKYEKKIK